MRLFFVVLAKPLGQSSAVHITEENNTIGGKTFHENELTIFELKKLIWKELYGGEVGSNRVNQWTLWKVKDLIEGDEKWKALEDIEDIEDTMGLKEVFSADTPKGVIHILVQPPPSATTNVPKVKGISRLGGLGGTNMKRKEDGLCYEGLDLTHIENVCQRKPTIKRLLDDLFEKRIILIRSPSMAGKTSLSQLLEYNILQSDEAKKGSRCVFRISLLWMVKYVDEWTFAEGFKILMNMKWDEFIQLSFASCGHYGAYIIHGDHSVMDISPPSILHKNNTWGFADVRFTKEEFDDYFNQLCEMRLRMLKKDDIPFLRNYVREITAYHPGFGKGKDGRLFERVWQMEFYRASLQVLPEDIYPSVDVGKAFGSKGYVDFYVNDKCNWAIELLRDGVKLNEHQQRFHIYVPILRHTKQWAIIDIRDGNMKASESEKRERNDIYVICAENFETVQLVYPNGDEEDIWLLGKENLLGYDLSEFLDDQDYQMEIMEIDY
ncbi:2659_t:CDS:2 [Funneliformis mosseae]|uniref:2659_t:CDS:1 n=1 Tax=Funneliformis mosseae TaxID=27381 RepID=A0A9N9HD63_FUNMO|nr:2659_t:CDS:2 [Funneliformis mosseae]